MDENLTNQDKLDVENGQNEQNQPHAPEKKRIAKAWYWMLAALLLIVALIIVLSVVKSNNKKEAKLSLAEAVSVINSRTPALDYYMVLDSVIYDREANRVTYYNAILEGSETNEVLMRNYYNNMSEEDLRALLLLDLEQNPIFPLVKENKALLCYVFNDVDGKLLRKLDFTYKELATPLTEDKKKRASLMMIARFAEGTQSNCPQKIDENTSITSCQFDTETAELVFSLILTTAAEEMDMTAFEERVAANKEAITHTLSHDQYYINAGITVIYKYNDKNGKELAQVVVTPEDYKEYHHHHEHEHGHDHGHAHHHE